MRHLLGDPASLGVPAEESVEAKKAAGSENLLLHANVADHGDRPRAVEGLRQLDEAAEEGTCLASPIQSRLAEEQPHRRDLVNDQEAQLDEPTNDLDLDTIRQLEDYLADFGGCIPLVSHDRAAVEARARAEKAGLSFKEKREYGELMEEIERLEAEQKTLEESFQPPGDPLARAADTRRYQDLLRLLEQRMALWEELAQKAGD